METGEKSPNLFKRVVSPLLDRLHGTKPLIVQNTPTIEIIPKPEELSTLPTTQLPQPPLLTRQEKKEAKKLAYQLRQRDQKAKEVYSKKRRRNFTSDPAQPTAPAAEEEFSKPTMEMTITPADIPWITEPEKVPFELVRLETGGMFWYADFIRGMSLQKAKEKVEKAGKMPEMEKLLLKRLEGVLQKNANLYIRSLEHPSTKKPISKIAAGNGNRIYCMEQNEVDGIRTFMRLAVCADTTSENNLVMPVLSIVERRK